MSHPRFAAVLLCGALAALGACAFGTNGATGFPADATAHPAVDAPMRFRPADPSALVMPADAIAGSAAAARW